MALPEEEAVDPVSGTPGQSNAPLAAASSPDQGSEADTGDDDDDAEDKSMQDPDEDDYVRDDVDEDIDAAFDGRYGDEDDDY